MNILPKDTFLGRLSFFEIYDDFFGPKCFSVKDELERLYLVYWSGDYNNGQTSKWVYMPTSQNILDALLREECSFHQAFSQSKQLLLMSTHAAELNKSTSLEFLNEDALSQVNLPPKDFSIELDEIQSIAPEANWDFNLRIAKRSGGSPDDDAVTKVLGAFGDIIKLLMKDRHNKSPSIYPFNAKYSSFDVKLGSSNQERAGVAIELFGSILKDKDSIEAKLEEYEIDPYRFKDLLDVVNMDKLELTLKSKTSETLKEPVRISSASLLPIIKKLEKSTKTFIDSSKVPQANCLDRVISIVEHRVNGGELNHELIEGISSERQVDYHTHAAKCLGLLETNNTVTTAGRFLAQKKNRTAKYQFLADRFESSDFGWAWMQWAEVTSLKDIDPSSAERFVKERVKGLGGSSIARRASSLASWATILKEYGRVYEEAEEAN
ncbi:DUF6575 domain-containing protein [Vibrio rotiferianus]|uniref:DUF6575 domain-containing protein n=1 Tax=Vibrio rotiferianus TaxID=190895 RepID=UPI000B5996AD|nr:DUF6575 domain-containing protein [Vibrio rotiferianus]ASI93575.1 hypothetical protein BSZ04_00685 [Vibrio rotiferianus]